MYGARLGARDAQHLRQAEVALPEHQAEVDGLGDAPLLGGDRPRRHAEHLGGGALVDVLARAEGVEERGILARSAPACAARSASSRPRRAGARVGDERLRGCARPTSVRMGMFCRFGSLDDSRPVAATAWLKVVCSAAGVAG